MPKQNRRSPRVVPPPSRVKRPPPHRRKQRSGVAKPRGGLPLPAGSVLSRQLVALRVKGRLAGQVQAARSAGVRSPASIRKGVRAVAQRVAARPGASPSPPSVVQGSATLAVVVLLHETLWPNWRLWVEWEALHGGSVAVFCHLKEGVALPRDEAEREAIASRLLPTRELSEWGELSLTVAMLHAAQDAIIKLQGPTHVAFASGSCIPVARADERTLPPPGTSFFQPFEFGVETMNSARSALLESLKHAAVQAAAPAWAKALQLNHQWVVLAVPLVLALSGHAKEIFEVGAPMERAFMDDGRIELAPDEALLLTAAHRFALPERGLLLAERMSTLVYYAAGSDDTRHPITWQSLRAQTEVSVRFGGRTINKKMSLVEALADAALPENNSLFLRKVHLVRSADVEKLRQLLLKGPWKS